MLKFELTKYERKKRTSTVIVVRQHPITVPPTSLGKTLVEVPLLLTY
jgi:hypothetical protein